MLDTLGFCVGVNFSLGRGGDAVKIQQEFLKRSAGFLLGKIAGGIDFDAVTRGNDYRLFHSLQVAEFLQCLRNSALGESEFLTHSDRRGMMTDSSDDDGHTYGL